jgi:hypothetical protein
MLGVREFLERLSIIFDGNAQELAAGRWGQGRIQELTIDVKM